MKCRYLLLLAMVFSASSIVQAAPASAAPGAAAKGKGKVKPSAPGKQPQRALARRRPAPVDYAGGQVNFSAWEAVSEFSEKIALRHSFSARGARFPVPPGALFRSGRAAGQAGDDPGAGANKFTRSLLPARLVCGHHRPAAVIQDACWGWCQ